jgi:hypothetical protein
MGVWREGAHDDLVLAVALACWAAWKTFPNPPQGHDRWWRREDQWEWERKLREGRKWDAFL